MNIKTLEEFTQIYNTYGYLDMFTTRRYSKHKLNDREITRAYDKYVLNVQQYNDKISQEKELSKDAKVSLEIRGRDFNSCRLLKVLTTSEYAEWKSNHNGIGNIIDAAHVFPKSSYPKLRYDIDNVVCLNRYSHSNLDTQRNPINGNMLSREEHTKWWKRIVGTKVYETLELKVKEKKHD